MRSPLIRVAWSAAALLAAAAALADDARTAFEASLPEPLLRVGPRGLLWWQWLAIPAAVVVAILAGRVLGWVTIRVARRLASRTSATWDDLLIDRLRPPVRVLWALVVASALEPALLLDQGMDGVALRGLKAGFYLVAFWGAFRALDVAFGGLRESPLAKGSAALAGLLPLGRKVSKLLVLAVGLVAVLSELGFQVASLLAGLGIGGLALALAAQKTVENLFGSVSISVDQPFRVGDFVLVDGTTLGTVEALGLRSTRIRTLNRTLVTIPNGRLADMRVESFAARDRFRLLVDLGLYYSTTAAQMREVLEGVERVIRAHPACWQDAVAVRFNDFKDSSLNVEVMAWFHAADWNEFTRFRQELFLQFMEVVERAGTGFAFPTRTLHVESLPAGAARDGAR
jgi:MscS family membrane protein